MSYFKEFCESIHKTKAGYVPDLQNFEDDFFRDAAMSSFLADKFGAEKAESYLAMPSEDKNIEYALWEIDCQDAIDAYNQGIDDAREKAKNLKLIDDHTWISMFDPYYKYASFNQAEIEAGFSGTGREFC
jgi:hypothetical protein